METSLVCNRALLVLDPMHVNCWKGSYAYTSNPLQWMLFIFEYVMLPYYTHSTLPFMNHGCSQLQISGQFSVNQFIRFTACNYFISTTYDGCTKLPVDWVLEIRSNYNTISWFPSDNFSDRMRFYGVMVSILDSESSDPSSSFGRTLEF